MSDEIMLEKTYYLARQLIPDAIIGCQHKTFLACKCVRWFNIDKNCPLTQRAVINRIASFELNRMNRLAIDDPDKSALLTAIIDSQEDEEDLYVQKYEQLYHPLLPKETIEIPESNPVIEHSPPSQLTEIIETIESKDLINTVSMDVSIGTTTSNYFMNFVRLMKYILILLFLIISPIFFS